MQGGGALSIAKVSGKPIKFVLGENEIFRYFTRTDGIRILGMGDAHPD